MNSYRCVKCGRKWHAYGHVIVVDHATGPCCETPAASRVASLEAENRRLLEQETIEWLRSENTRLRARVVALSGEISRAKRWARAWKEAAISWRKTAAADLQMYKEEVTSWPPARRGWWWR